MADGDTQRRPIKLVDDLGPALPDNPVVKLLAHYGVPISETRSLRFKAEDQDIASKYKEYRVFLTGARPNEKWPITEKSFANEQGEIVINCWQIVIHWGERPCLEARWYIKRKDFLVVSAVCPLAQLNQQVVKHLTGAFELLLWVQERLSKAGRPPGSGLFKTIRDFRTALWDTFATFTKKPTQEKTIKNLRTHDLCQKKESEGSVRNQTKTLRDWIERAEFKNFNAAWDAYLQSVKKRE